MTSARACGMPALAVPGDQAWDGAWTLGFEDRDVTIVLDADRAGRLAAQRIQRHLTDVARTVTIADLAPDRQVGYDLTDWLHGIATFDTHHTLQCMLLPDVLLADEDQVTRSEHAGATAPRAVVVDEQVAGQALVRAVWTDDDALSTRINRQAAHYTGQQELADAIDVGLEARRSGDDDTAVVKLGRAVQIAAESGNAEMASLLASVVDVEDAATGRVRLRSRVEAADEMMLETRSTRTPRVRK
jgi:von Willebrand factor type A C-terminal domain